MIRFLIEKEFKLIFRNSFLPRLIVFMPIMMMIVLPFAANLEVENINFTIVDNDRSSYSTQLVDKISASQYFILENNSNSYSEAMKGIESGASDIVVEIPYRFEQDIVNGNGSEVYIAANAVNATKSAMGSSYLVAIVSDFVSDLTYQTGIDASIPIVIATQNRFNPTLNYKFFMVPALMVMLLTIMCGSLPALNIVGEKESGTIEQMNVTPVGKFQFIFAKIVPYWIIGFVVLTICFGIAFIVYGLVAKGAYLAIYLSAFLFIFVISGFGLLVSNFSATMQQAMFVMFFFLLILILLSGLFTPVQSMPIWAQNITIFNPLKYFIQIMRGVYLKGSTLSDIYPQLLSLSVFAIILNGCAILSYRKTN